MSEANKDSVSLKDRKAKPRRAEIEIYRPGALRQLKEARPKAKVENQVQDDSTKAIVKNIKERIKSAEPKAKLVEQSTQSNFSRHQTTSTNGNEIARPKFALGKDVNVDNNVNECVQLLDHQSSQTNNRFQCKDDCLNGGKTTEMKHCRNAVKNMSDWQARRKPMYSKNTNSVYNNEFKFPQNNRKGYTLEFKRSPKIDCNHKTKDGYININDKSLTEFEKKLHVEDVGNSKNSMKAEVKGSKKSDEKGVSSNPGNQNEVAKDHKKTHFKAQHDQSYKVTETLDSSVKYNESSTDYLKNDNMPIDKTYRSREVHSEKVKYDDKRQNANPMEEMDKLSKNLIPDAEREESSKYIELTIDKKGSTTATKSKELEVSKFLENIKLRDSSEETVESDCTDNEGSKMIDPMTYIIFKENSFYKPSSTLFDISKTSKHCTRDKIAQTTKREDQSFVQKQRKKRSRHRERNYQESPGKRGLIEMACPIESSTQLINHPIGHKLLFNPNNPNKPVVVAPSARDLPHSWDNYGLPEEKDISDIRGGVIEESGSKGDPSVLYNIQRGEMDINYYVSSNQLPQEFRRIMDIRKHLQNCYRHLLLNDMRLCQEKNIENALWKSLYYAIIEKLREYILNNTFKEKSLMTLFLLVEDGMGYLQNLLVDIQRAYQFSLESHIEEDLTTLPGTKNRVRQALFSCQKILLCLGDLARYKEQYSPSPNFFVAKQWYEKALQVNPRNGRPFNQLAIIAVSQKRPLDIVYYYVRSLAAANPFASARDSLISMFDDIRRKYEGMEELHSLGRCKNEPKEKDDLSRTVEGSLRREIWIRPDSGVTNKRTLSQSDHEEDKAPSIEEIMKLPNDQLLKLFLTSYLHCHGMLFSRVGLDHFMDALPTTLVLFQAMIRSSPPRLTSLHLLQILTLNMFAIDNTQLRDTRIESGYRSTAQDLALLISQEMFARLVESMVSLFPKHFVCGGQPTSPNPSSSAHQELDQGGSASSESATQGNQCLFTPPLSHFIPAVKVWCDWLLYQSSVWNPPPTSHDHLGLDTWGVIAELATIVKGIGDPDVPLTEQGPAPHLIAVTLPEDTFLRGYSPLLAAQRVTYFVPPGVSLERTRDWVRVNKLKLCLSQFLCGVEPPVLRLQKTDQGEMLVPIVSSSPPDSPSAHKESLSSSDVEADSSVSDIESNSDNDADFESSLTADSGAHLASTVRLLAVRKKMLERKQRQQRKMQALMEGSVTLEMEVRPRYLIPDTNCFIEHLAIIETLAKNNAYTLMVPLVVMSELDGLSRDAAVEKYGDAAHAVKVREGAVAALHYIRNSKHPNLKCVTSQGSILPSAMFTSEIDSHIDATNDDKILSCCLQFCKATNKRRPIQEGVRNLYREVVLLTEDRNLRVKAYAEDVPVRDLLDFSHWAGIK